MAESLKHKAMRAVLWNAVQKYGALIIAFSSNIVLARQLTPDDYGLIGILMIFVSIASAIVDSGFSSALIQKKNADQTDFCTVFFWNIVSGIVLYILLFLSAPFIANYFDKELLCPVLRLTGVIIIINAFSSIQSTILTKGLNFKTLAIRTLLSSTIGASVGILLVLLGNGVWGLVWQYIATALVGVALLWGVAKWRPQMIYSWQAFRNMFKFGSYIFISSICNTLYLNIQSFIIGKAFSIKDLGYYSQAKKLEQVPVDGTSSVLSQVLFPIYATIADDRERHIEVVRKNMKVVSFISIPLMLMLIIIAKPLIVLLFTEKWVPSVPMFQILCIVGMFSPINVANTEIFRSIGAGGLYFTLQTIKRIIGLIFIFAAIPFGLFPMLWAIAAMSIVTYAMNLYCTNKYFGYSYKNQLEDILPSLFASLISGVFAFLFLVIIPTDSNIILAVGGVFVFAIVYLVLAKLLRFKAMELIISMLKHK